MSEAYLWALGLTLLVEVPVVAACFAGQRLRMATVCALTTTPTHLAMHFLLPGLLGEARHWVLVGELAVLLVEAAAYALLSRPRDLPRGAVASALANGLSYGAGALLCR